MISKGERDELIRVAKLLAAKNAIGHTEADIVTELIAGGLESEEAKAFLERMPTPAQLMPSLNLAEIEAGR